MAKLNLTANGTAQERILNYLEENASDVLVEKINNGTAIEKDGKQLVNKKTLNGFMQYANDEARKIAEKGARYACIDDPTVYGWAIHYFEEDNIEGTLYNEDGTEYKPAIKTTTPKKQTTTPIAVAKPKQPSNGQTSLFDLIDAQLANKDNDNKPIEEVKETECNTEEQEVEVNENVAKIEQQMKIQEFYLEYLEMQRANPNSIVITRLGDFYEVFDKNAITLSNELNLTITSRNVGLDERVPLVGFPYHVADVYINKIRSKHNIVVVEPENIRCLEQTTKTNDGNIVEIDTGEIVSENNPYIEKLSALLDCKIKFVR
ncbi:MAG: hypothetical protein K2M75_04255 [Clostridia bacterium]|nr:hypothetical protein [Clostridia bacterium]